MKKRYSISFALILAAVILTSLAIPGFAESGEPVAESFGFKTYRGVSYGGQLSAVDPDGDVLSFEITTEPVKGTIELSDDGSFVYTPAEGKRGKDYFGYKAVDAEGKRSQEATVIIELIKQDTDVCYADMHGTFGEYAAVRLAECGAFTGQRLGSEYYFCPDETMSRGEFLALCLELTDAELLSGVVSTGFSDDASIPVWQKEYVSTAVRDGIVTGYTGEGGAVFSSGNDITKAEAVAILSRALRLADVSYVNLNDTIPAWIEQDTANLYANDIVRDLSAMNAPLTRAEAAMMLSNAMGISIS